MDGFEGLEGRISQIVDGFRGKRVLVIGDLMLDKDIIGDATRISPEAPVPVVRVKKERVLCGGAGNVAYNAVSFGAEVHLSGAIGGDIGGAQLIDEFSKFGIECNGVFVDNERPTIRKVRVVAMGQQLLRCDYENQNGWNRWIDREIVNFVSREIKYFDCVIISDYAKGIINDRNGKEIVRICNGERKIVVVDPKPRNMEIYKGVSLVMPNQREASEMSGILIEDDGSAAKAGLKLVEYFGSNVLIKRGERGISLFERGKNVVHIPTRIREVYNIIGAGDTAVAAVGLALCCGAGFYEAAVIGNIAAGIKVGKRDERAVSVREIKEAVSLI